MLNLAGNLYEERQLLVNMMRTMRSPTRYKTKRWVVVIDTFMVGSTVAHALCRELGFDPDEDLSK